MTDLILRDLSVGVIAISLAAGATVLIGASWYDIAKSQRDRKARKHAKGHQARPLVSVIVYSYNQAEPTLVCLASLLKNTQRKMEAIVINNGSDDQTKLVLKEFVAGHSKRAIKVINKRRAVSVQTVVQSGLRAAQGDVIIVVSGDYRFERRALALAADGFLAGEQTALIPATMVEDYPSALNLWLRFKNLLGLDWQKTASFLRPSGSGIHFGVFYGRQMVKRPKTDQGYRFVSNIILNRQIRPSLGNPAVVAHELAVAPRGGKKSALRPFLRGFKLIYRVIALPIFTWYALYLAMNQGYSYLLLMGWAVFTFIFIFVIWSSEHLAYPAKAKLTALAPAVFSLAVIMIFVEAVSKITEYVPLLNKLKRA